MNVDSYRRRAAADRTAVGTDNTATTTDSLADNQDHPDSDNHTGKTKENATI